MTKEAGAQETQIQEILNNFQPESQVKFESRGGHIAIFPHLNQEYSQEMLLNYIKSYPSMTDEYVASLNTQQTQDLYREAQENLNREFVGGFDITRRSLASIEEIVPGVTEKIKNVQGKIVILGNGLSLAAQEMLALFKDHEPPEIVIVDLLDYGQLVIDLFELKKEFIKDKIPFPRELSVAFDHCKLLLRLIRSRQVKNVRHLVGSGQVPESLKNADLVLNIYGPPPKTAAEQHSLLKPGGVLVSNDSRVANPTSS